MISADLWNEFQQKKSELLDLMQQIKNPEYGGIALSVINRVSETGRALVIDDTGAWSGRLDMDGYAVIDQDTTAADLGRLLRECARVMGEITPSLDGPNAGSMGQRLLRLEQEHTRHLEENGDRLLGILIHAMNQTVITFQPK